MTTKNIDPAARLQVAQRPVHRSRRLVAHRVERAKGVHVWDAEGKSISISRRLSALQQRATRTLRWCAPDKSKWPRCSTRWDVHPHALKAQLARELSRLTFERWAKRLRTPHSALAFYGKVIFNNSGFEAVDSTQTAMLATETKRGHHRI